MAAASGSGSPRLLEWLARRAASAAAAAERTRRLDSDAAAVQIVTVHASKGLEYPVVYLPVRLREVRPRRSPRALFHDDDGAPLPRRRRAAGPRGRDHAARAPAPRRPARSCGCSTSRSPAPSRRSSPGGRRPRNTPTRRAAPDAVRAAARARARCPTGRRSSDDDDAARRPRLARRSWAGRPSRRPRSPPARRRRRRRRRRASWRPARFDRERRHRLAPHVVLRPDPAVRASTPPACQSEPEVTASDDETAGRAERAGGRACVVAGGRPRRRVLADGRPARRAPRSAPWCTASSSTPTPRRPTCAAELRRAGRGAAALVAGRRRRPTSSPTALLPAARTRRSVRSPPGSRCATSRCATGCASSTSRSRSPAATCPRGASTTSRLRDLAPAAPRAPARRRPAAAYADQLDEPGLGDQALRGYLSGSIDVVLRVPAVAADGHRFVVVDYKTNRLGEPGRAGDRGRLRPRRSWPTAMLHSHYPLQALLYSVVAAPLPALAAARLRPGDPPRRRALPLPARHVRARDAVVDGSPAGRLQLAAAGRAGRALSDLLDGRRRRDVIELVRDRRPARPPPGRAAPPGCCATLQPGGRARRPPTSTSPRASAALGRRGRRRGRARRRAGRARGAHGLGLRRPRPSCRRARCPSCPGLARRRAGSSAVAASRAGEAGGAAGRGRPALPRPLLARGGPGPRRPAGAARPRAPPVVDAAALEAPAGAALPGAGYDEQRAAALRRGPAVDHRAHRRPRHRQDHHGRRAARAARRAGAEPARCASPSPRRPARRRPGSRRRSGPRWPRPASRRATATAVGAAHAPRPCTGCSGWRPGQPHPVPPRPRQPAAARRGRRRRDLDGVADDDGPAARGGAPRRPAGAGRRPRPAGLGRGRRRARRPGRGPRATATRRRGRGAARPSHRFGAADRRARRGAARRATPTRALDAAPRRRRPRSSSSTRRRRARSARAARRGCVGTRSPLRAAADAGRRRRARSRRSTRTGCCAPTATGPTASATGTARSSAGSPTHTGLPIGGGWGQEWYAGRPLLRDRNDYGLELFNGDTGVVVADGRRACAPRSRRRRPPRRSRPRGSADVETMHAMTMHKSQGSQADEVTVLLPPRTPGCSPASSSTPRSPAPRTACASSAPRPPSAPPSAAAPSGASGLRRAWSPAERLLDGSVAHVMQSGRPSTRFTRRPGAASWCLVAATSGTP